MKKTVLSRFKYFQNCFLFEFSKTLIPNFLFLQRNNFRTTLITNNVLDLFSYSGFQDIDMKILRQFLYPRYMILRYQNSQNPNSFPTDVPIISSVTCMFQSAVLQIIRFIFCNRPYLPQKKRFVLIRDKEAGTD